jgi:hemolysin activation/secretion protein
MSIVTTNSIIAWTLKGCRVVSRYTQLISFIVLICVFLKEDAIAAVKVEGASVIANQNIPNDLLRLPDPLPERPNQELDQPPNQESLPTEELTPVEKPTCVVSEVPNTGASSYFSLKFENSEVEISGSSVFNDMTIRSAIEQYKQQNNLQNITPEQFADAITGLYLSKGYINSLAVPGQREASHDEIIKIRVIEGRVGQIEIEGTQRLDRGYICDRIKLGVGTPLNTSDLEDQLRLLRVDPIFDSVEGSLRPEGTGVSTLIIRVQEAPSFIGGFSADNYSPPSVGSERLGLELRYRNLTGLGDEAAASYYRTTTSGAEVFDLSYEIPLNSMNGSLQLRAAPNRNRVTEAKFKELEIRGYQELYALTYRQPLVRSPNEEFALSLNFTYEDGQTFVFDQPTPFGIGPDENGVSRTSVLTFGQDYTRRDSRGAWALRSQFNFGVDLFDVTSNKPPIPDGHFFSWLGQVQRAQILGDDHLLLISADLQLTPDSLLPGQQFVVGGGQSIRGYRQNIRSGDNGFRFSIEDRITVVRNESGAPTVQLAPFIDVGSVWNQPNNPNKLLKQTFLPSVGVGLLLNNLLNLDGFSVRVDYGLPLVTLDNRGENAQDQGFSFSVMYRN